MRRPAALISLAVMLLAPSPSGGGPRDELAGSFGEYLEVQLVNVEVFASDRQGRPVAGLTAEDFHIFEDGVEVEITNFRAPIGGPVGGGEMERPGQAPARSRDLVEDEPPLYVALFVDNVNTGPASRNRIFAQLLESLEQQLRPVDRVMVATYDGGLNIRMPFSRDRKDLLRTLREVESMTSGRLFPAQREQRMLEIIEWHQEQQFQGSSGNSRFRGGGGDPCVHVGNLARQHADEVYNDVQNTIGALSDFVSSLAGIPGRKVLLHVSDGIPLIAGAEAWNYAIELCDGTGHAAGVPGSTNLEASMSGEGRGNRFNPTAARSDMLQYDTTDQWQQLAAYANAQRVVFYPMFAAGLVPPNNSQMTAVRTTIRTEMERVRNDQDTLAILADETGGEAFFNTNDFRPALAQVVDESRSSYQLAYASPHPGDGKRHKIEVEVDRPGISLRHRKSYEAKAIGDRVADGVLSTLLYGIEENPLRIRVETEDDGVVVNKRSKVTVRVKVPLAGITLLPKEGVHTGLFTVYVAAREESGGMTPVGRRSFPVRIRDAEIDGGREREFVYEVEIELRHGRSELAVALRDEFGGETSYVTASVDTTKS